MEDAEKHDRDGLAEVQRFGGFSRDRPGLAQLPGDVPGSSFMYAPPQQQGSGAAFHLQGGDLVGRWLL
jgi:hypothetical protein